MAVARAEGEREHGRVREPVQGHVVERADAEERAVAEGVERDSYVVRGDVRGGYLVRLVRLLPPARLPLKYHLARAGGHAREFRELRVVHRPDEGYDGE